MPQTAFDSIALSRRALIRSGGLLAGSAVLAAGVVPRRVLAQGDHAGMHWPHVSELIDSYVDPRKLANMVAALGWGTQAPQVIAKGNLAIGQDAPAGIDSLYRIYSMTKPITGMAAMMLIDAGKMGLDQPLYEILPAFKNMMVQKVYDGPVTPDNLEPAKQPITIRMLLTHTAGLGYSIIQNGPIKDLYEKNGLVPGQVSRLPLPELGRAKPVEGLANFADGLAKVPLVLQPGEKFSYSVGLDLMGRVIEVVSGMPFDEFLRTKIFEPCGMTSTFFQVPEKDVGRLTTNYAVVSGTLFPIDPAASSIYLDKPAFPFGGAGLVSSPRDYDRFLEMLLNYGMIDGTRVMTERAVRVGTSNLLPKGAITKSTWIEGQGFGAGGRVSDGAYGWGGAAGTVAFVSFKAGLRAGMFTQYMPSDAYPIHTAFPAAVLKDLAGMQMKKAA
ncbi:serine hydrolase [Porphyrobacter algicida]|uniref:Serine hydrolase n=1 Tax=Qipengyuania algicida TaxID=1836209 RepID=A0A845AE67_9SPHN|nr:serine hydrolase domain-containing protein [Qipengyuania algicida]MXP28792.1 serine hydrolase [Qipengyuania algicida]